MTTLLIAERFNMQRRPVVERWLARLLKEQWTAEEYCRAMIRLGCFQKRGRSRLESLGVEWEHGMNLMPPDEQRVSWDAPVAARVAGLVRPWVEEQYTRVYLVGRRVSTAFGFRRMPYQTELLSRYVILPHPSGLNRMWNT